MEPQIQKDANGMREDLANHTMVKVPEVVDANAGNGKAFGQVCPHGFHFFANPGAKLEQRWTVRGYPKTFSSLGRFFSVMEFRMWHWAETVKH